MKQQIVKLMMCLCLMGGASTIFAQSENDNRPKREMRQRLTPEQRAEKMADRMAKQLSLTAEQKAKVLEITKKYAAEKPSKEILKKQAEEIQSVLTTEQKEKWQEVRKKMRPFRQRGARQLNGNSFSGQQNGGDPFDD